MYTTATASLSLLLAWHDLQRTHMKVISMDFWTWTGDGLVLSENWVALYVIPGMYIL